MTLKLWLTMWGIGEEISVGTRYARGDEMEKQEMRRKWDEKIRRYW